MTEMIRAIVEIPKSAFEDDVEISDELVDRLIETFDTPLVGVLDVVEQDESAWHRSERF